MKRKYSELWLAHLTFTSRWKCQFEAVIVKLFGDQVLTWLSPVTNLVHEIKANWLYMEYVHWLFPPVQLTDKLNMMNFIDIKPKDILTLEKLKPSRHGSFLETLSKGKGFFVPYHVHGLRSWKTMIVLWGCYCFQKLPPAWGTAQWPTLQLAHSFWSFQLHEMRKVEIHIAL